MICFRYLLFLVLFLLTPHFGSAATIHGTVYEWSTFEPLDNALVEVNSTPVQFRVATSGVYSFNLPPGDYLIKTSYYHNSTLEYYHEDTITVTDPAGDFVVDILLFPLEEEDNDLPDEDIGNITIDIVDNPLFIFDWKYTAAALLILFIAAVFAYYHYNPRTLKEKKESEPEIVQEETPELQPVTPAPFPEDLMEIITILQGSGGRITQKDLRKKLNFSESKVSLMIADLEARGMVQKIKKGRGNIILLIQEKD